MADDSKLINFMSVTGAESDAARHFLEASNWNLDTAISQFLDGPEHEVRAPDRVKQQRLLVHDEEPQLERVAARPGAFADYRDEKDTLSQLFALPRNLMHVGDFQSARKDAKSQNKFLLVCLTDESDFGCVSMNRDVWADETVQAVVESSFVLWLRPHLDHEAVVYGERYDAARLVPAAAPRQLFRVHPKHPHFGVIDPRTGRRLWTRDGVVTADRLIELLSDVCDRHSMDDEPRQTGVADVAPPPPAVVAPPTPPPPPPVDRPLDDVVLADEPSDGALVQFRLVDKASGKPLTRKRRFHRTDTVAVLFKFAQLETGAGDASFELRTGFPPRQLWPEIHNTLADAKLDNASVQMKFT